VASLPVSRDRLKGGGLVMAARARTQYGTPVHPEQAKRHVRVRPIVQHRSFVTWTATCPAPVGAGFQRALPEMPVAGGGGQVTDGRCRRWESETCPYTWTPSHRLATRARDESVVRELWVTSEQDGVHLWMLIEPLEDDDAERALHGLIDIVDERFPEADV
jgi:hypothetical protein